MTDVNLSVERYFDSDDDYLLLNAFDGLRRHPTTWHRPNAKKRRPPLTEWRYWQHGKEMAAFASGLALLITRKGGRDYHAFAVKSAGTPHLMLLPFVRPAE